MKEKEERKRDKLLKHVSVESMETKSTLGVYCFIFTTDLTLCPKKHDNNDNDSKENFYTPTNSRFVLFFVIIQKHL